VDLIAVNVSNDAVDKTIALVDEIRGRAKLRAAPVLLLVSAERYSELSSKYSRDASIRVVRSALGPPEIAESAKQLLEGATGGMVNAEEAAAYKTHSIEVLRDLAISSNSVLRVEDASGPLITALGDNHGDVRLQIGEVLSYVPTKTAQSALMDAAMTASADERVKLLGIVAESAKRSGNQLADRQIKWLREMATKGQGEEATAAAALMGALNLPNADIVPLIIETPK